MGEYQLLSLRFEWDDEKLKANEQKHRVTFEEAAGTLLDPFLAVTPDVTHSKAEERQTIIGQSVLGRILHVTMTLRGATGGKIFRIISARKATLDEQRTRKAGIPPTQKSPVARQGGKPGKRGRRFGGTRRG